MSDNQWMRNVNWDEIAELARDRAIEKEGIESVEQFEREMAAAQPAPQWGQPAPIPNDRSDIQSLVIADVASRREHGIRTYGTPLQAHNGRDALQDAYEEALDLAMYLRQMIEERKP